MFCRVSAKGSVLYRQENVDSIRAQDALQTVIDTAKMTSEYMAILETATLADGQVVILDQFHRETVLPQPNGGFFKETELCGFVLIVFWVSFCWR